MPDTTEYYAGEFQDDPFGGDGILWINRPDERVWVYIPPVDEPCKVCGWNGDGQHAHEARETRVDAIVDANKELFNASEGQRWGEGRLVANIPMGQYFKKFMPARKNGDDAYIKRLLNDADNRAWRTFKGRI